MRIHLLIASLLVLGFTSLTACKTTDPAQSGDASTEEYAIYRLVIGDIVQPVESMPILDMTVPNHEHDAQSKGPYLFVQTSEKMLKPATLDDFWAKNQESKKLEYSLDLPHGNVFITADETAKVPQYPGYIELSRVGFDKDMTQALVYVGNCWKLEGFQGRGYYVMLDKQNDVWTIDSKLVSRLP